MIPAVFINCKHDPFIREIMNHNKLYETRTRNTLRRFRGKRIILAETGNGRPVARCTAVIDQIIKVYTRSAWTTYFPHLGIAFDSKYDWKPCTKYKYLYHLTDVRPIERPFVLPEDRRHGHVWMEYHGEEVI